MYGWIFYPVMGPYTPRFALAFHTNTGQSVIGWWGFGISTPCGALLTRGNSDFVLRLSEL